MKVKRRHLAPLSNKRVNGRGTIQQFSLSNANHQRLVTFCLRNVLLQDETRTYQTPHVWCKLNKTIGVPDVRIGDIITFSCKVEEYYLAPEYTIIQGYGIRSIRNPQLARRSCGESLRTFIQEKQMVYDFPDWITETVKEGVRS